MLNFLKLMTIGDITKCQSPKNGKKTGNNWVFFSPPQADRINRSRRNLARKRRPQVYYSSPNLTLVGKRGSVQEPPKMSKFAQNCGFWPAEADTMNTFRWNVACKCRPWVCSSRLNLALIGKRGSVGPYRTPKNVKICQKLWFLATGSRHNEHIQIKFGV